MVVLGSSWGRFWSSWAPLRVVFGRSGGRFGAFSAFQLIDSTRQLINSSIQLINSSTHQPMALRHFLTRPGGLRAARLNPPPPEGSERVWTVFEIFFEFLFEFFELKESSQAPRIPPFSRAGSRRTEVTQDNSFQNRTKNRSKFSCHFGVVFDAFWVSFWHPKSTLWAPFSLPDRSWTLILFENFDFLEILRFSIENLVFSFPDGPQNEPKMTQVASKKLFFWF